MKRLFALLLTIIMAAPMALAWEQSANAVRIVPNDYWFNHRLSDATGTPVTDPCHLGQWPYTDDYLNLLRAWAITTGDSSIVLVFADKGTRGLHPEILPRILRNEDERRGISGVDDDGDGVIDNKLIALGNEETDVLTSYPPWYTTKTGYYASEVDDSHHGTRVDGQVLAATNNEAWSNQGLAPSRTAGRVGGTAGIDWKAKAALSIIPASSMDGLANWIRYLKYERGYDIRLLNLSYICNLPAGTVKCLIEMNVLPVTGATNSNSPDIGNLARNDSLLMMGNVVQNYRKATNDAGSSYGAGIDAVGYSTYDLNFALWPEETDITDPTSAWRPSIYVPGVTGTDCDDAVANMKASRTGEVQWVPGCAWKHVDGTDNLGFWDGNSGRTQRAVFYLGGNDTTFGVYDVRLDMTVPARVMNSGAVPQAVGVGSLFCAMAKNNGVTPAALSLREYILRGCVSVDSYNSTASGGTNSCGTGSCDGLLGAGRLDAYRTMTLWGKVKRDTTLQGDVYVSGDVLFTDGVEVTIAKDTKFHIAPDDITHNDPWQPLIQYDPDGVADGDGELPGQLTGEESKIEIIFDDASVTFQSTEDDPITFSSFSIDPGESDWSQLRFTDKSTVIGYDESSVIVTGAIHGIYQQKQYIAGSWYTTRNDSVWTGVTVKVATPKRLFYQTRRVDPDTTEWFPPYGGKADTAWAAADTVNERRHLAGVGVGDYEARFMLATIADGDTAVGGPQYVDLHVGESATPAPSGVAGYARQDSVLAIVGINFGTKAIVPPVVFDTVESGSFSPFWGNTYDLKVDDESRHDGSSFCGTNNFRGSGNTERNHVFHQGLGGRGFFAGPDAVVARQWFVQYWFKMGSDFTWGTGSYNSTPAYGDTCTVCPGLRLSSTKLFRLRVPDNHPEYEYSYPDFVLAQQGWTQDNQFAYQTEGINPYYIPGTYDAYNRGLLGFGGTTAAWALNTWHLFQFEFKESTLGSPNGRFRWWIDGKLKASDDDMVTTRPAHDGRIAQNPMKNLMIIGFYDSWRDVTTDDNTFYIDDAYADSTFSRVEIGDAAIYDNCTHREIQTLVSWSPTSVSVSFSRGSFPVGTMAFVFVVNSVGVPSNGYPVLIGEKYVERKSRDGYIRYQEP